MKTFTLSNGQQIPAIGFGTYNPDGTDTCAIIRDAIDAGYRYFDTASLYETERALGKAMKQSQIAREALFIASKLWMDEMGYKETKEAFARTLERLQTDYLDLYLIHWPKRTEEDAAWKERIRATWEAMEELHAAGHIRGLGLSNFLPHHAADIYAKATIQPVVDQLELHPGYMQEAAVADCKAHNVLAQAWSPLGRAALLSHPLPVALSGKYGKSPAQISLRYLLQRDIAVLVKASDQERMRQNLDIFDFEISEEDMSLLTCMPQTAWSGEHPDFNIPKVLSNFAQ
ncbi:MAG: aldo/keto reductase [Lachnospiraceae bacterium]|nr:aldo/keto reductase [Lachnospiraceae bacterium]